MVTYEGKIDISEEVIIELSVEYKYFPNRIIVCLGNHNRCGTVKGRLSKRRLYPILFGVLHRFFYFNFVFSSCIILWAEYQTKHEAVNRLPLPAKHWQLETPSRSNKNFRELISLNNSSDNTCYSCCIACERRIYYQYFRFPEYFLWQEY